MTLLHLCNCLKDLIYIGKVLSKVMLIQTFTSSIWDCPFPETFPILGTIISFNFPYFKACLCQCDTWKMWYLIICFNLHFINYVLGWAFFHVLPGISIFCKLFMSFAHFSFSIFIFYYFVIALHTLPILIALWCFITIVDVSLFDFNFYLVVFLEIQLFYK